MSNLWLKVFIQEAGVVSLLMIPLIIISIISGIWLVVDQLVNDPYGGSITLPKLSDRRQSMAQPVFSPSSQLQSSLILRGFMGGISGELAPSFNGSHREQVKYMRQRFKNYSKEEFREMSKEPVVKEILAGMCTIPKEDIADRIEAHIKQI